MTRKSPRLGGKDEATPSRGRIMRGDGYVIVGHDGRITTTTTGHLLRLMGMTDDEIQRVKDGERLQTPHGVVRWSA